MEDGLLTLVRMEDGLLTLVRMEDGRHVYLLQDLRLVLLPEVTLPHVEEGWRLGGTALLVTFLPVRLEHVHI